MNPAPSRAADPKRAYRITILLLVFFSILLFSPAIDYPYFPMDDGTYVAENPHVAGGLTPGGLRWALTADLFYDDPHTDYWQPVTLISRLLDGELFGMWPGGHHTTNIFIHILNAVLLFHLLTCATGSVEKSAFAAAVFAAHPLQVEPVVWITARKDLLGALLGFLTLLAYVRFAKKPSVKRYAPVFIFFALSLMSKPHLATLPFLLLLLDKWPLGRKIPLRGLCIEKIPLLALSAAITLIHILGPTTAFFHIPLYARVLKIPPNYIWCLEKTIWPAGLAIGSPQLTSRPELWKVTAAVTFLISVSLFFIAHRKTRPYLCAGWFWFLIALLPTVHLGPTADRFMYMPIVGVSVLAAWGLPEVLGKVRLRRPLVSVLAGSVIYIFSMVSYGQVGLWKDNVTFLDHSVRVTDNNYLAEYNLGAAYCREGNFKNGLMHYRRAAVLQPDAWFLYYEMGRALARQERFEEAVSEYERALRLSPGRAEIFTDLGIARAQSGREDDAVRYLKNALALDPNYKRAQDALRIITQDPGLGVD